MKTTIPQTVYEFNEFLSQLKQDIQDYVNALIEKQLETDVDKWLYRNTHVRRGDIKHHTQAICQRCGSRKACRFTRNGHR